MVEEQNNKETRTKFRLGRRSQKSKKAEVPEQTVEAESLTQTAQQSTGETHQSEAVQSDSKQSDSTQANSTEADSVQQTHADNTLSSEGSSSTDTAADQSETKKSSTRRTQNRKVSAQKSSPQKSSSKANSDEQDSTQTSSENQDSNQQQSKKQGAKGQQTPEALVPSYPELKAESTTHLLFFAPELPKVEPVADQPDGSTRRRQRTRGTSEDRSSRNTSSRDQSGGDESSKSGQASRNSRSDRPAQLKGSTRLEAKRQRRRENRDINRRRQVITEVEFQARRESTERTMVVRSQGEVTEIAVLEDKILAEHYVTRSQNVSLIGNVYLGRVQNVLPSMEAAFVDIGRGRNAVLYSGEVDWDSADNPSGQRRIELALKTGDPVLVQVTKDPVGHKGARLTSQVSLPGRYLVFVPNGDMNGISRKLAEPERVRLKKILKEIVPENSGVIVRTAAEGASHEQLALDIKRLTTQWAEIQHQMEQVKPPYLLHSEPDLLTKIVRDVFNEDFQKLVIQGSEAVTVINRYLTQVAPDLLEKVEPYTGNQDVFAEYRVNEQIAKALDRKVWLPSGGSLIIDRTEAMTVIDVNTGKFIGSGGNLEETVTKNNLEAAEEIVRQLRLRDIGGIIVIDFIDMVLESNRDLVLRRLVECLSRDRTKHQVAEVTSLGLVQMTRKKIGLGLAESFEEAQSNTSEESSSSSSQSGRKSRSSNRNRSQSNGNGSNGNAQSKNQARELTDDVKNAVAQIVASTIHPTTGSVPVATGAVPVVDEKTETTSEPKSAKSSVKSVDQPEETAPPEKPQNKSRRSRRVTVTFDQAQEE